MPKTYRIAYGIHNTSYLISLTFTILSTVLTLIDKREVDRIIVADMIFESLLVISLTLNFIFVYIFKKTILGFTLVMTSLLWLVTGVLCFFTYTNSENKDFFGICLLLRIARITCIFFFIANIAGIVDDRDDFGYDY